MILEKVIVGTLETNCYIFGDEAGEAAVIDPGDDAENILDTVKKLNCDVKYIILTHGHYDHIGAVKEIKEVTGAQVLVHELDSQCLVDTGKNLSAFVGSPNTQIPADRKLKDGETIEIGKQRLKVIHTPGHTKGSICLLGDGILFSGDTLFEASIGRTDLPGGSSEDILDSLNNKLMKLGDDIKVYPGHMEETSIGYERKCNPFIVNT